MIYKAYIGIKMQVCKQIEYYLLPNWANKWLAVFKNVKVM